MTGRMMGFYPNYTIYKAYENGDVMREKWRWADPQPVHVTLERRKKLNAMWFQCEPCER